MSRAVCAPWVTSAANGCARMNATNVAQSCIQL